MTEATKSTHANAFLLVVLALLFFGFLMVYSATSVATRAPFAGTHFAARQIVWGAVALAGLAGAMFVPPGLLRRAAPYLFAVSLALLAAVLVVGTEFNGARRWFRFGVVGVQPSELAKVGLILFLAAFLARPREEVRRFTRTFVVAGLGVGLACGLIVVEPDFGCAFLLAGWALLVMLVAGVRWWYVGASLAAAAPLAAYLVVSSPMHLTRVMIFLDPWQQPRGAGHQLVQSLIALGSGGLTGAGLGLGQQRLSFLPEAPTDFIFAIIGEQLGLMGTGLVLVLFGLLLYFGGRILLTAPGRFEFLVGFGALSMIIMQALANVAVTTGSMPTKGLALPFISFGGSGLVWAGVSAGLVLNVARAAEATAPAAAPATRAASVAV